MRKTRKGGTTNGQRKKDGGQKRKKHGARMSTVLTLYSIAVSGHSRSSTFRTCYRLFILFELYNLLVLGIPGLDESELPRIIGFSLGSLLLLNHFTTPDPIAASQLRSEAVGILLATVAGILPSVRRLLKGSNTSVRAGLPYNLQQKLLMANWLDDTQKQDLAWGSYALIKNTKTMSVMVWFGSQVVLVRGYWNWDHEGETKEALEYFYDLLSSTPIVKSENNIYIPSGADTKGWKIVPRGATALFYHPLVSEDKKECVGGLLAISNEFHGYNKKDMVWVSSLARKFRDTLSKPPTF